jgi:tetratricopeptide (TPR) repeat protein
MYSPADPNSLLARGQMLNELGRYSEALICYDNYLVYYPYTYQALLGKGKSLLELGKYLNSLLKK